jgi:MFS family permease
LPARRAIVRLSGVSTAEFVASAERTRLQRRTVRVLAAAQVLSGLGTGAAIAVGALLAENLSGSRALSGIATTATVLGAALTAIPLARLARSAGRRPALATGWLIGTVGGLLVLLASYERWFWLFPVGAVLFGAATASGLQSRFAATDLAAPATRARDLSLVIWATTVGAVVGPNLVKPGTTVARALHVPAPAGPWVFAVAALLGAALVVIVGLRPDPLLVAGRDTPPAQHRRPAREVLRGNRAAQTGLVALVIGHVVMVAVMTMTPVHMSADGMAISVIGFTISLHIAGMYALSPVFGRLADGWGRRPVIVVGVVLLAAATLVAGTSGMSTARLTIGLVLLGLGWSAEIVAGSALLAESVEVADRPAVQGASDLLMNLAGAAGGAGAGVVVAVASYGALAGVGAALLVAPLLLAIRRPRVA